MSKQQNQNEQQPRSRTSLMRSALLAMMSLLLTVAVAASLTFALFVNETPDNHVRIDAGDLKISAMLVERKGRIIDTETNQDGSPKNPATFGRFVDLLQEDIDEQLSNDNAEDSVFQIVNAVPTMWQKVTIEIKNEGTITFDVAVRIDAVTPDNGANQTQSNHLMQQIQITLQLGDNGTPTVFMLSEHQNDNFEVKVPGGMLPGTTLPLYITAEFLNDEGKTFSNMDAVGGGVEFDFTIIATQDINTSAAN